MNLDQYIRDIPDFPKPGILFKDIMPLLADPKAFRHSIKLLAEIYKTRKIDAIAAAEARGFLFAAPLALELEKPLVPLRKPGKLPYRTYSLKYELEYGSAELQMHTDGIQIHDRVLLIDDVLATGGTMKAGASLIEQAGGVVDSCAFLIELTFLQGRQKLQGYEVFSLLKY
ncbi:adenine phosphoribosyltransferase [Telmatocola sphagniphila]|uniref:Adenine phosphoribosyltransferase n=1 Tax=Telmatocola sphagniphila TaxID=1123043 RepID=A0A8E6B6I1_9BACT|nr:adenine phosphoribosyltransferase [Telmatocola sphagniphila]QVL32199.1 adenine phosphoribosyltransferase [Telmatocola sphagniphila]